MLAFLVIVNIAMGMWAMWLYAAIRPRYGPGPKTATVAGFAWWVVGSLMDANRGASAFSVQTDDDPAARNRRRYRPRWNIDEGWLGQGLLSLCPEARLRLPVRQAGEQASGSKDPCRPPERYLI